MSQSEQMQQYYDEDVVVSRGQLIKLLALHQNNMSAEYLQSNFQIDLWDIEVEAQKQLADTELFHL